MNERLKKILFGAIVLVLVAAIAMWIFVRPGPEHIADTNGAENYNLQKITAEDVIAMKMGSRGSISRKEAKLRLDGSETADGIRYSCRKFTGVLRMHREALPAGSDVRVYLSDFKIQGGNFAFYVLLDGKLLGEVKPDERGIAELIHGALDQTATVEYVIAGESASFSFVAPLGWD
jgi:hypothetical protein